MLTFRNQILCSATAVHRLSWPLKPCRRFHAGWTTTSGITADTITKAFDRVCIRAQRRHAAECQKRKEKPNPEFLHDGRFHNLRHEATSRLFERGFNVMEVAAITGHKTLQMLKRYTHLRAEDLAKKLS